MMWLQWDPQNTLILGSPSEMLLVKQRKILQHIHSTYVIMFFFTINKLCKFTNVSIRSFQSTHHKNIENNNVDIFYEDWWCE
jgi:hypothetical protein